MAMRHLYAIQHTDAEFLGLVEDHLEGRGIRFTYVRPLAGEGKMPATAFNMDGAFLLGGGPWGTITAGHVLPCLGRELRLVREFLKRKRPVVGFGLGAQILALAAGGATAPAPLVFSVGTARRVAEGALAGYLPAIFPQAVYMRDRPVPPPDAEILAVDEAGLPAIFRVGELGFGFAGHPGTKSAIVEDLIMEFDDAPADCAPTLERLRLIQRDLTDALVPIMAGLIEATGLMRPIDDAEARRRQVIPIQRG
jgi:GMP synthase-like glutamine amidotransferase